MAALCNTAGHYIFALWFLLSSLWPPYLIGGHYILSCSLFFFTGSIARSATRRCLTYSEADFEVYRPAGATYCTDRGEI